MVHHEAASRYELLIGDDLVSFAEYQELDDAFVFHHTVTDPRFGGRGFAADIVRFALDDVRRRGKRVVATCWFVAKFIDEHAEYADLRRSTP